MTAGNYLSDATLLPEVESNWMLQVSNATTVHVRKPGNSRKWRAHVLCEGKICDLALLSVSSSEFWADDLMPLEFVEVPELQVQHCRLWPLDQLPPCCCAVFPSLPCFREGTDKAAACRPPRVLWDPKADSASGLDTGGWLPPGRRLSEHHKGHCVPRDHDPIHPCQPQAAGHPDRRCHQPRQQRGALLH